MHIVEVNKIPKCKSIDLNTVNLTQLQEYCWDLIDLCEEENGVGISAVQAGIPISLFLVKNLLKRNYNAYLNCSYTPTDDSDKILNKEGCLSLKRNGKLRTFKVFRYRKVLVEGHEFDYDNLKINSFSKELISLPAVIFQHEIDHCNDILISDIGEEINA